MTTDSTPPPGPYGYQIPVDPAAYYEARWGHVATPAKTTWLAQLLVALGAGVVIAALGFPLAWLWVALSPTLTARASGGQFFYTDIYGSQWAAWESLYVVISVGAGIVLSLLAWFLLRRFRGPFMVVALALGGGTAGWIIWRVGRAVGRASFVHALRHPVEGEVVKVPIDLRIQRNGLFHGFLPWIGGNLTYLAIAAVATYCLLAGFALYGDLNTGRRRRTAAAG